MTNLTLRALANNLHEVLIAQDVQRKCRKLRFYASKRDYDDFFFSFYLKPVLVINKLTVSVSFSTEKQNGF